MRKKTLSNLFDLVLWNIIYLLPLIIFVVLIFKTGQPLTLVESMESCGLGILSTNSIFTSLNSLFGSTGIFPMFMNGDILFYFSYFICVWICHLVVDVLLWIVRYSHKLIDSFGGLYE